MGFSKQEYWSGLSCPPPRDLPHPGIEPTFLTSLYWQVGSLPLVPPEDLNENMWKYLGNSEYCSVNISFKNKTRALGITEV